MPRLRVGSLLRKGRSQRMEGEIISQYHIFHQDLHRPQIGLKVGVGKLVGKCNIPSQVIDHVHVEVLRVAGPQVITDLD